MTYVPNPAKSDGNVGTGSNTVIVSGKPNPTVYVPNQGKADGEPGTGSNARLLAGQKLGVKYTPEPGKTDDQLGTGSNSVLLSGQKLGVTYMPLGGVASSQQGGGGPPPPDPANLVYDFPVGASVRTAFYNGSAAIKPSEYTISAWVKPQQAATYRAIAARTGSLVADPLDTVSFLLAQGPVFKGFVQDDGINPTVTGLVPVVPGVWVHVALTCLENSTLILYVSGAADGIPKAVGEIVKFGTRWWIAAATMALGTDYYAGRLADVAIWKKALSAAEVLTLSAPVRDLPLTVQPGELVVYCPMSDVADGVPVSTDWLDLGGNSSQLLYNQAVGRTDTI